MTASPGVDKNTAIEILIVEDNPPDVYLLQAALTQADSSCRFHVVDTGKDAFRFLQRQEPFPQAVLPDLVILDLNLPFRSGEEVLGLIRNTERLEGVVVILFSSAPVELRGPSPHVPDAYIIKPSDLDSYFALGREIIDYYRSKKGQSVTTASTGF